MQMTLTRLSIDCEHVFLLLENTGRGEYSRRVTRARGKAASSAGAGSERKGEPALHSYSNREAQHSSDGVILLVGDDTHLSAAFISDMRGQFQLSGSRATRGFAARSCDSPLEYVLCLLISLRSSPRIFEQKGDWGLYKRVIFMDEINL